MKQIEKDTQETPIHRSSVTDFEFQIANIEIDVKKGLEQDQNIKNVEGLINRYEQSQQGSLEESIESDSESSDTSQTESASNQ